MDIIQTGISGLLILQPKVFGDDRGHFFESYNRQFLASAGVTTEFVQDNQSLSQKGVLRGLHFQNPPFAQAKLVRVIRGAVLDVAVDIRKGSPTYGKHHALVLSGDNNTQFLVPEGFAHGFLTLEDNTVFAYKCSNYYHKPSEDCIAWNDPDLGIAWGIDNPLLSEKDKQGKPFKGFDSLF